MNVDVFFLERNHPKQKYKSQTLPGAENYDSKHKSTGKNDNLFECFFWNSLILRPKPS